MGLNFAVVSVLGFFWFVASPPCGSLCAIIVHMIAQPPGPPRVSLFLCFFDIFPALHPTYLYSFENLFEAAFLPSFWHWF